MSSLLSAAILGIIQGVTEFLPVSSTGHLIIAEHLLGVSSNTLGLSFDIALHVGSALALILLFWKDIVKIIGDSVAKKTPSRLLVALIIATIPAGIAGVLFEHAIEKMFRSPTTVAVSLLIFSAPLLLADYLTKKSRENAQQTVTPIHAAIIGICQAIAVIPGVSRSGSTITGALLTGYNRTTAARFAFLLSIPIILLAGVKQTIDIVKEGTVLSSDQLLFFAVGFISSFIVAYLVVRWFLSFFQKFGFFPFVIYRVLLAMGIFLFLK